MKRFGVIAYKEADGSYGDAMPLIEPEEGSFRNMARMLMKEYVIDQFEGMLEEEEFYSQERGINENVWN